METININNQTEGSLIISEDSYDPPRIEVVEVSLEKGFVDSTSDFGDGTWYAETDSRSINLLPFVNTSLTKSMEQLMFLPLGMSNASFSLNGSLRFNRFCWLDSIPEYFST